MQDYLLILLKNFLRNVIVDDCRLSYKWEKIYKKHHYNLIAFDDLKKKTLR